MPFLQLAGLKKSFGDQAVLRGVDLAVEEGEILALLGPSGSGKTTLLRLLAGFERPDAGTVTVGGDEVSGKVPARRGFGMVFQHYALFPHMSVGENVAFGLHGRGLSRQQTADRVAEVLALVDLDGFEDRRVSEISGGQQQRVALARALAPQPRLLLLDEPLSNLDPELREQTRQRLRQTLRQIGITTVLVTHEQEEAFHLGDRVAVLHRGRLEQIDRPHDLYRRPATRFVAGFVGRASMLRGEVADSGSVRVGTDSAGEAVTWPGDRSDTFSAGEVVDLAVRPESLELSSPGSAGALPGRVRERRFSGVMSYVVVALEDGDQLEVAAETDLEIGAATAVTLRPDGLVPRVFGVGVAADE